MTSPTQPVVLPMMPGVDQTALAPLLAALQERKARQLQQQQIMVQQGQLSLQQEEFAAKQKELGAQKKALEQQGAAFKEQLGQLSAPGEIESELTAAAQSADPQTMELTMKRIGRRLKLAQLDEVKKKYYAKAQETGTFAPGDQANMFREFAATDPDNPNAGAWINAANQAEAGARPRGFGVTRDIRGKSILELARANPDLTKGQTISPNVMYSVRYDPEGKPLNVLGEARASGVDRLNEFGDSPMRKSAEYALRMNNALADVVTMVNNPNLRDEVSKAVTLIEGAGTAPLSLDDMARYATHVMATNSMSDDAQVVMNSVFDMLAARAQQGGGLVLPPFEWAIQVRALAPVAGESEQALRAKLERVDKEVTKLKRQGGPATAMIQDLFRSIPEWRSGGGPRRPSGGTEVGAGQTPPISVLDADITAKADSLRKKRNAGKK